MLRALTSILLSLILVVTSHSMAAARHGEQAVGSMVICSGESTFVIYVDAEGAPTLAPHLCPDCMLHDVAVHGSQAKGTLGPTAYVVQTLLLQRLRVTGRPGSVPQARGPPVLI